VSASSPPTDHPLTQALQALDHLPPLVVALSGGADSTAMLVACAQRWPGQVRAVHIHHGLQAAADQFAQHCEALCARRQVPLVVHRVQAQHASGESPEETARNARYAGIEWVLQQHWGGGLRHVLLAQHADDQAETVLLALSRGAGLPGLAAMPNQRTRGDIHLHRPWLALPGALVRPWLQAQGQTWCEDPTNQDTRYTRNRIRAELLPVLDKLFPSFRQTLARTASHAAQAQALLEEVAAQDLALVGQPPVLAALQPLSTARLANVLRHWLKGLGVRASHAQLQALMQQVQACTTRGHRIHIKVGEGFVHRVEDRIDWYNP
jgi:tRNA(Ile)-lysidine synthase